MWAYSPPLGLHPIHWNLSHKNTKQMCIHVRLESSGAEAWVTTPHKGTPEPDSAPLRYQYQHEDQQTVLPNLYLSLYPLTCL